MFDQAKFKSLIAADGRVNPDSDDYRITSSAQFTIMRKCFVESLDYAEMAALIDKSLESGDKLCDFHHKIDEMAIDAFEEVFGPC